MEESASAEIQEIDEFVINMNDSSESKREAKSPRGNETRNGEADREGNDSVRNEHQNRVLVNDITHMLESSESLLSPKCCIYKVPRDVHQLKEKAYIPEYISIGPFHHGDKRLETMEKLKVKCFKMFMEKAEVNVEKLVSTIRDIEGDVRHCYAETIQLKSNDFVKMIMLDASFIIMFFLLLRGKFLEGWKMLTDFAHRLIPIVLRDMLLLENQLPFFVIKEIFNLAFGSHSNFPSFTELTFHFCERFNTQKMPPDPDLEIKHFVDLVRTFFLPPSHKLPEKGRHIEVEHLYNASQLHKAGVKFKKGTSKCLFDLKFTNGVLEIPCLKLHNYSEQIFRNLMALEQCHYVATAYVTDYVRVLDFLIDTSEDVDLLVQKGILIFPQGNSNVVKTWVNNLAKHHTYFRMNSDYSNFCNDLNKFYEDPWHNWKATLRHDYFTNPWRTTATVAAIILLVLTFTQTICSIISLP